MIDWGMIGQLFTPAIFTGIVVSCAGVFLHGLVKYQAETKGENLFVAVFNVVFSHSLTTFLTFAAAALAVIIAGQVPQVGLDPFSWFQSCFWGGFGADSLAKRIDPKQ